MSTKFYLSDMTRWKKLLVIVTVIVVVLTLQIVTYYTMAHHKLETELLSGRLNHSLDHSYESVFIRDFYTTDCWVGESRIFFSHHLQGSGEAWRKKFNAKNIAFQSHDDGRYYHPMEDSAQILYETWLEYPSPFHLSDIFTATQVERLIINHNESVDREVTYRWWLCKWIPHSEFVEVISDLKAYREKLAVEHLESLAPN